MRTKYDIADIFRRADSTRLPADQYRSYRAIISCRTAECGAHLRRCNHCGAEEQSYNSCWNRHCPKCQGSAVFEWVAKRQGELLPVPYFHVVFTLPEEFRALCFANKGQLYELLFRATSKALLTVGQNNHGLRLGFFGVLHTWNQELMFHPHIHYVVPGGGIDAQGKWCSIRANGRFLMPVRILSRVFRGIFIDGLRKLYRKGELYLEHGLSPLRNPRDFERLISKATRSEWVVYAKRPFSGAQVVVKYLSAYTHRVAISNHRLTDVSNGEVTFSARDRLNKAKKRQVTLPLQTFVQRFLQHTLPRSFRRIRYFGFMYNQRKHEVLAKLRAQFNAPALLPTPQEHPHTCKVCTQGLMRVVLVLKAHRLLKLPRASRCEHQQIFCLGPPLAVH